MDLHVKEELSIDRLWTLLEDSVYNGNEDESSDYARRLAKLYQPPQEVPKIPTKVAVVPQGNFIFLQNGAQFPRQRW